MARGYGRRRCGLCGVYTATYNAATADVAVHMTGAATQAVVLGYEQGDMLATGKKAAGRRVGLVFHKEARADLTAAGWTLFDAAVMWAASGFP